MIVLAKNDNEKICAMLSYVLLGIIWYFVDENLKKSKFAQFHVKQAIVLLVLSISVSVVGGLLPVIDSIVILVGNLFIFVLWVMGIYYAATDKKKELPVIGQYAAKLNI